METTLAYLAGVMDSDGYIGIKRNTYSMRVTGDSRQPTYSERLGVKQVEPQAVTLLRDTFGGSVSLQRATAKRGRALYSWQVTDKKAADALRALLPFLRIKKAQAENCLALRVVKEESKSARVARGRGHIGSSPRSASHGDAMERHYITAKALNRVGVR